ncbi:hypothetical protein GCM10009557_14990 [Virgisporangium ochraceum]|uniref:HTH cro/C1-type domain-containing protein n=1 Tax=Virgisporangium ochraceum TaxID=65505 RepID=A0A8J4EBX6_9ACTN|nr:helix-turn-helix transcriptional regulator [Virgisporangium ochraceum]GIJ66282.1 hypothetical protein Voc01_011990 [Virgisporangium ochraceum]
MTNPATVAPSAPVEIDAAALRAARDKRSLTQAELGGLCGITAQYVSQLETGFRTRVSRPVLTSLAGVLRVRPETLRKAA